MIDGEIFEVDKKTNPEVTSLEMKSWTWIETTYNNDTELVPNNPEVFVITFNDAETFSVKTDCNTIGGAYQMESNQVRFGQMYMTEMFCEDSQEQEFISMLGEVQSYFFTNNGDLIFDLKIDSGTSRFR